MMEYNSPRLSSNNEFLDFYPFCILLVYMCPSALSHGIELLKKKYSCHFGTLEEKIGAESKLYLALSLLAAKPMLALLLQNVSRHVIYLTCVFMESNMPVQLDEAPLFQIFQCFPSLLTFELWLKQKVIEKGWWRSCISIL
jgi:hypothetical protein